MRKIILTMSTWVILLTGYSQTIHESGSNGTSGDAVVRIESDKDNNNEGDNARIELYQDGGSLGAFIGFNQDWGGTSDQPDNLFRIGTRYGGNNYYNNFVIRGNTDFIGMGTADPISSLHVSSGTSGSAILTLEADTDNNEESDNARINFIQDGGLVNAFVGFEGNAGTTTAGSLSNALLIASKDATTRPIQIVTGNELKMTINKTGVGIGINQPSESLEVNGTIRSKEVKVEASPWPDYVFSEGYDLMSLAEISDYIAENQHLPGMPSAKQVAKEGVALGEMNAKLLEKVEELTLYVISLQNQLHQQQREINELKK
ncbi:hypothetical protein [Marinoscillum sp.]|uniref:hypothetical protein n=1 Tax=Marinoscillum sp. TaxID=2024838 RepID=UPI003BAAC549